MTKRRWAFAGLMLPFLAMMFTGCETTKINPTQRAELERSEWQRTADLNTVEGYKEFLKRHRLSEYGPLAEDKIETLIGSAPCSQQKELYRTVKKQLSNQAREKLMQLYGDCIRASEFCEYCGQPAVGWCTMRHKWVCAQHRYFVQGNIHWRCP